MTNFLNTLQNAGEMNTEKAASMFGWEIITKAYDKGRITFDGDVVIFIQ